MAKLFQRSSMSLAPLISCLVLACARIGGEGGADALATTPVLTNNDARGNSCPGGGTTSITGTTYAPNGKLPLYNVMVYVPSAPLPPFTQGVTCDRCGGATVRAVASAISDERGQFRITDVPAGKDVPLVFQVGKWRRKVMLPNVVACQENPITDGNLTRLPRNRQEGDMPRIAVTTGACDEIGCLLPKVGVDLAEIGTAGQGRAVTFYQGEENGGILITPPGATSVTQLWRSEAELSKYDLTLLSCECDEFTDNKGPAAYEAMSRYLAKGGRIFGSHFMYVWYLHSPDSALAGALAIQRGGPQGDNPLLIDTSFPKGKAMADWMKFLDPAVNYGEIAADVVFDNLTGAKAPATRVWGSSASTAGPKPHPRIVTVNTPAAAPADQQCGRAVHLDAHIGPQAPLGLPPELRRPLDKYCEGDMTKNQQALAFLFFDLASCIQDDSRPVDPPVIVP